MARFVYIDETGSVGTGGARQPHRTLVAAVVDEAQVRALSDNLRSVAMRRLGWLPAAFEFHGNEIWNGIKHWADHEPRALIAAHEAAIDLPNVHDIDIALSSIDKSSASRSVRSITRKPRRPDG